MRRSTTFDDVLRSSAAAVEVLLREGDAQERVWAAWVLGLRAPADHDGVLAAALGEEADPGVRRHLLVVLAGAGRRDLVARATARDRDADVRATGVRLLARLAPPEDAATFDLMCTRAIDIAWQVRHAVADTLPIPPTTRQPLHSTIVERLVGMLFDPDPDVRAVIRARVERGELPVDTTALLETLDRVHDIRSHAPPNHTTRALVPYRPPLRPL